MAAYRFKAMDDAGKSKGGLIEAASAGAARQALRAKGLLPLEVVVSAGSSSDGAKKTFVGSTARAPRIPLPTLTLVTRQMATLLQSGLRIEDALATIAEGQPPKVAGLLMAVRGSVLEGRSFGAALAAHPQVFSDFYRATVRAGEQAGRLDKVMGHLASHIENRARNRQTVQLALLYPALLAVVSLSIVTLLMAFVVPDIVRVFSARGADLPFLTRALIATSGAVRSYGLVALSVLVLAALGFGRWIRHPANRLAFHRQLARARGTKKLVQRMNSAQFAGTLATLLQSGVPLTDAMAASADVTPNLYIRANVIEATEKVRQGMSLKRAMDEAGAFPAMLVAMVASGEASGKLGPALDHAATDQQRELDAWVRALVALVEPAILLVMGGLVLIMVLSILLPIVSLNSLAGGAG
ncbi:MAG: type II secretion system F family protein [Gemmobacter sp.]